MILKFSPEQVEFLKSELQMVITPDKEYEFSDQQADDLLEACGDIEVEEAQEAEKTGQLSRRGEIAVALVDLITM